MNNAGAMDSRLIVVLNDNDADAGETVGQCATVAPPLILEILLMARPYPPIWRATFKASRIKRADEVGASSPTAGHEYVR